MSEQEKYFVLDTNVLLHSPAALTSFKENHVVLPIDVVGELDKFKSSPGQLGRNARETVRMLDQKREQGRLTEGVPLTEEGGTLRIEMKSLCLLEHGLSSDIPDNRIVSVAYRLLSMGKNVVFVTKDMNLRIKSDALGIDAQDYLRQRVNFEELTPGWREVLVDDQDIRQFYRDKFLDYDDEYHEVCGHKPANDSKDEDSEQEEQESPRPYEGILLRSRQTPRRTALGLHTEKGRIELIERGNEPCFGIQARNLQQRLAMELLLREDVHLVCLMGKAGTGKTLLAIVAGLHSMLNEERFETLLVSRPIMPLGNDLGFLPGGVSEKLQPWMKPIFDNLQLVLKSKGVGPAEAKRRVNDLLASGRIEMEALTYIRGRSIQQQFLIVDECQNLTPHEVKTIISRAGANTKIVLTGDPYQIDNPYLDTESNGLTYVCERMKDQPLSGHVVLKKTERSRLASLAADFL